MNGEKIFTTQGDPDPVVECIAMGLASQWNFVYYFYMEVREPKLLPATSQASY